MARRTLAQYQADREELKSAQSRRAVRSSVCEQCGAHVLVSHVDGLVRVQVDPRPLVGPLERYARAHGRLVLCLRWGLSYLPDRLGFQSTAHAGSERCRREHDLVAEHVCDSRRGRWRMDVNDIFGQKPARPSKARTEPVDPADPDAPRVVNHRYRLLDPDTGARVQMQRVSTFAKTLTDQYNLSQWQMRCAIKGVVGSVELIEQAQGYHVRHDATAFDELASEGRKRAGAYDGANTGTALHTAAELYDAGRPIEDIREEHRELTLRYAQMTEAAGLTFPPEYIERLIVCPEYGVAGRFDRVARLPDGSHAIADLKSGATLTYAMNEIPVQLRCYARGFNAHGIWVPGQGWVRQPVRVREDIAIVIHLPANGSAPDLWVADIGVAGKELAQACVTAREERKRKDAMRLFTGTWPILSTEEANADAWLVAIRQADTVDELIEVSKTMRLMGAWTPQYAALCKERRAEIEEGTST